MPHDLVPGRRVAAAFATSSPDWVALEPGAADTLAAVPVRVETVDRAAPPAPAKPTATRFTAAGRDAFLEALAETGMVRAAIRRSGLSRATLYRRRAKDARFAAAWAEALAIGLDLLRDEAVRRALDGVERPVFHAGKPVGAVREHSDTLLMFLMRAHDPLVYREPRAVSSPPTPEQRRLTEARADEAAARTRHTEARVRWLAGVEARAAKFARGRAGPDNGRRKR